MKSFLCNYIYLTILVLLTMAAAACSDEIKAPENSNVPEGLPATLSMKVDLLNRAVISRADVRGDIPDQRITSLWIGLFNAHTGAKKDFFSFTDDTDDTFEENWRNVNISTTSGVTRVVGVANFENRFAVVKDGDGVKLVSLTEALNAIETFEDFENMAVTFNERAEISTSEPLNALLMTGRYSEHYSDGESHNGIIPEENTFVITPGNYSAPGCIHLRRLISQNKFNITYNTENIKSFKIIEWQAHNVPNSSWLRERNGENDIQRNSGEVYAINGLAVSESEKFNTFTTKDNVISFDYWQLENLHTGLEPAESDKSAAGDYYAYREREHKNEENGENTGVFSSLTATNDPDDYNNNASYLTFNVEMEMNVDENGNKLNPDDVLSRIVKATYTVHLGYCENKSDKKKQAMDFNCRRNAKYTYNITINNVNSMMVEALREGEPTPSIIGDITDSNQASTKLDCHYNVTNLYFTQKELEDFKFAIEAFGSAGERKFYTQDNHPLVSDNDFRFYSWIELRPTTKEDIIAEYKPHSGDYADGKTYYLHEMKGKPEGWYTIFINEYTYEDFDESGSINPADKYNWHWYCGAPDRRVWFNINSQVSADGHTSYYTSKYAFSQTSIQTYYDKSQDFEALGVEHVNESLGINIRNNWNNGQDMIRTGAGYEGTSGRYNLGQYLMGATPRGSAKTNWGQYAWKDHLDVNKLLKVNAINNQNYKRDARTEHVPAYNFTGTKNGVSQENTSVNISYIPDYDVDQTESPQYMEMITACLNRNRDNNGNGYIDKNEIRWFVPSDLQMIRVILGRQALRTPVMDYDGITAKINSSNELNSRFLIACANGKILWAMEGLSTSAWYPSWNPKTQAPWNVRCVRYMGSDIADFNIHTRVNPPYDRDKVNENKILMDRMDKRAIRVEAYRDSKYPMPPHVLNDQVYNRCFKQFEIHPDEVIVLNSDVVGNTSMYLSDYLSRNNPCEKLNDKMGKDGWRVPNQKELSIMSTYKKPGSNDSYYYSAEGTGVSYLISCSFTFFDNSGAPASATNPVNFQNHLSLKITTDSGQGTQASTNKDNGVKTDRVPNSSIGVRCVRDVP